MEKINFLARTKNAFLNFKKKYRRFPSLSQWKRAFKVLTKQEKILFLVFFIGGLGAVVFLSLNFYLENTEIKPAPGATYIEGTVGQPGFINPILADSNTDRDLIELLFSGLMKYNKKGEVVPDLAKHYEIKEEGRVYDFLLKENIFWHDNAPFSVEDIIFTIQIIQDSDYKNPERANWLGVKVEKISDKTVRFRLEEPYGPFLERTTLKILPKHIWEDIPPQRLPLAVQYNLQPIGCGPYKFKEIQQDGLGNIKSLTLVQNSDYFDKIPYISKIIFYFFDNEEDLIKAAQENKIHGLSLLNPRDQDLLEKKEFHSYPLSLSRYFAVFFRDKLPDGKSSILAEKKIRQALNHATDKDEILKNVLNGQGKIVQSPILPEIYGFEPSSKTYEFSLEKAEELFKEAGFEKQNGKLTKPSTAPIKEFKLDLQYRDENEEVRALQECLSLDSEVYPEGKITGFFGPATKEAVIRFQEKYKKEILDPWGFEKGTGMVSKSTRAQLNKICNPPKKEGVPLKLSLTTLNQSFLVETANILKEQWQRLGIEIEIERIEKSQLVQGFIKPRGYEALLFGQGLEAIPDLFPFWHSSWKKDPGLNLTLFENKTADRLLEETRRSSDPQLRAENYQKLQEILIENAPAIFLYSPDYIYLVSETVKGVDIKTITAPSKRFCGIENWYIKTQRVWK